jgi:hypothetical protein
MVVVHTIYGCRLDQPKINKLATAVADGITPSRVELIATWSGTRLRSDSLDGLRRAVDRCLQPGDPQRFETLEMRAIGGDRVVRVDIGEHAATVTVEACEAAWAIGKAEQIRKILLHAHGSPRRLRWRAGRCALGSATAASVSVGAALRIRILPINVTGVVLAVMLVGLAAATGFLLGRWRAARNRTVIWAVGALPRHGWAEWNTAERIAALTLLIGLLGVIVTVLV